MQSKKIGKKGNPGSKRTKIIKNRKLSESKKNLRTKKKGGGKQLKSFFTKKRSNLKRENKELKEDLSDILNKLLEIKNKLLFKINKNRTLPLPPGSKPESESHNQNTGNISGNSQELDYISMDKMENGNRKLYDTAAGAAGAAGDQQLIPEFPFENPKIQEENLTIIENVEKEVAQDKKEQPARKIEGEEVEGDGEVEEGKIGYPVKEVKRADGGDGEGNYANAFKV